jgi:hypothetical protein
MRSTPLFRADIKNDFAQPNGYDTIIGSVGVGGCTKLVVFGSSKLAIENGYFLTGGKSYENKNF